MSLLLTFCISYVFNIFRVNEAVIEGVSSIFEKHVLQKLNKGIEVYLGTSSSLKNSDWLKRYNITLVTSSYDRTVIENVSYFSNLQHVALFETNSCSSVDFMFAEWNSMQSIGIEFDVTYYFSFLLFLAQ